MISYAGVFLAEPDDTEIGEWILATIHPDELFPLAAKHWPGAITDSPILDQRIEPARPVRIGSLWWPWGASRFAQAHFVVGEDQLNAIRAQVYYCNGQQRAQPLKLDDGVTAFSVPMWMLPARPLQIPSYQQTGGKFFLLTLVDDRYWWWGVPATLTVVPGLTAWTDLYAQLGTAVGATIAADPVNGAYLTPTVDYAATYGPVPMVLDAIAFSVGQRIVRNTTGAVKAQNYATAAASAAAQFAAGWTPYAGGQFSLTAPAPNDLPAMLPGSVLVAFRGGTNTISLFNLALPQYANVTGTTFQQTLHRYETQTPDNAVSLATLATQAVTDWYLWRLEPLDQQYDGFAAWVPEGLHDIEWRQEGKITTRVQRRAFNIGPDLVWIALDTVQTVTPPPPCNRDVHFVCVNNCLIAYKSFDCGESWVQDFSFPGTPCPCPESGSGDTWWCVTVLAGSPTCGTGQVCVARSQFVDIDNPTNPTVGDIVTWSVSGIFCKGKLFSGPHATLAICTSICNASGSGSVSPCPQNCYRAIVTSDPKSLFVKQSYANGIPLDVSVWCQSVQYVCSPDYPSQQEADAAGRLYLGLDTGTPTYSWLTPSAPCPGCPWWCVQITVSGSGGSTVATTCCPGGNLPPLSTYLSLTGGGAMAALGTVELVNSGGLTWFASVVGGVCGVQSILMYCQDFTWFIAGADNAGISLFVLSAQNGSYTCGATPNIPFSGTFLGGPCVGQDLTLTVGALGSASGGTAEATVCVNQSQMTGTFALNGTVSFGGNTGTIKSGPYTTEAGCQEGCAPSGSGITSGSGNPCCPCWAAWVRGEKDTSTAQWYCMKNLDGSRSCRKVTAAELAALEAQGYVLLSGPYGGVGPCQNACGRISLNQQASSAPSACGKYTTYGAVQYCDATGAVTLNVNQFLAEYPCTEIIGYYPTELAAVEAAANFVQTGNVILPTSACGPNCTSGSGPNCTCQNNTCGIGLQMCLSFFCVRHTIPWPGYPYVCLTCAGDGSWYGSIPIPGNVTRLRLQPSCDMNNWSLTISSQATGQKTYSSGTAANLSCLNITFSGLILPLPPGTPCLARVTSLTNCCPCTTPPCCPQNCFQAFVPAVGSWIVVKTYENGAPANQVQVANLLAAGYTASPNYPSAAEAVVSAVTYLQTGIFNASSVLCGPDCISGTGSGGGVTCCPCYVAYADKYNVATGQCQATYNQWGEFTYCDAAGVLRNQDQLTLPCRTIIGYYPSAQEAATAAGHYVQTGLVNPPSKLCGPKCVQSGVTTPCCARQISTVLKVAVSGGTTCDGTYLFTYNAALQQWAGQIGTCPCSISCNGVDITGWNFSYGGGNQLGVPTAGSQCSPTLILNWISTPASFDAAICCGAPSLNGNVTVTEA